MKNYFTIRQTAEIVDMTAETLRHYDRIGLVKPCKTDKWTGYRYYSQQEIVRLNTVKALRCMDLTLSEIKDILAYDDFGKIVAALDRAEIKAEQKIAELTYVKEKIERARMFYRDKLSGARQNGDAFVKYFPQRVILLSDSLQTPTVDNLWDYHRHFYNQMPAAVKDAFSFEDSAGIYEQNGKSRLFAICTRYSKIDGLTVLPQGRYLCADCTEENRKQIAEDLLATAKNQYGVEPAFTVRLIVLAGILQWNYQAQVFLSE